MAIQINVPLTTKSGLAVASGSYCVLKIELSTRKNLEVGILFYKDKAAFDNLADPFRPTLAVDQRHQVQLTDQQYANFTNLSIHQLVANYIETFTGPGTTQLVN